MTSYGSNLDFIQRILGTKVYLSKVKVSQSSQCSFCSMCDDILSAKKYIFDCAYSNKTLSLKGFRVFLLVSMVSIMTKNILQK